MTRPIILLDVDGVLADFTSAAVAIVNSLLGRSHALAEVDRFDFCDALNLDAASRALVMANVTSTQGFARLLKPYPHARPLVDGLRERGTLLFVTSPWEGHETWAHERYQWLREHMGVTSDREVISTAAKLHVDGDVLIDDRTSHLAAWCAQRMTRSLLPRYTPGALLWRNAHNGDESWPWIADNAGAALAWVDRVVADMEVARG